LSLTLLGRGYKTPVARAAVLKAQMEFEAAFYNEVLNPQNITPMKQDDGEENLDDDFDLSWSNIHNDVNSNVEHMKVTTEEVGENLTVLVEGTLERILSLKYMGDLFGENIIIEENSDTLLIQIPTHINNWTFKAMDMMVTRLDIFENRLTIETPIQHGGNEKMPFSFTLHYKI